MKKIYRNYVFDIIMAVVALVMGILMLPPIGIGGQVLNILLALILVVYLAIYLFDKVRRARGTSFILILIEFSVVSLIAVGLILQQFHVFGDANVVCPTIGIVMWLRGVVVIISMYVTAATVKKNRYNLPEFVLCIFLASAGVFLFARPITSDLVITWIICVFFLICFISFGALALLFAPIGKKHARK